MKNMMDLKQSMVKVFIIKGEIMRTEIIKCDRCGKELVDWMNEVER